MSLRMVLVSDREVIAEGLQIYVWVMLVLPCSGSALGCEPMRISWGLIYHGRLNRA
jgi:hypothetical protein